MRKNILRSREELREIFLLLDKCDSLREIARRTGIPKSTVQRLVATYQTLANFDENYVRLTDKDVDLVDNLTDCNSDLQNPLYKNYAYILGLYLGDGHITDERGQHKLTIALDEKYPLLIQQCVDALQIVFAEHSVYIASRTGCKRVIIGSTKLPLIFPQHGEGHKHNRKIELAEWQKRIVDAYPLEFFRGLYHSDGSRSQNIVKGKNYPRYFFTNMSDDIRQMFCETTEKLGLQWTQTNAITIAISQREDVIWLDDHIGAKA
jgi:hypothetical protein